MKQLPKRILSIDVFRAITMLLMIFVNDVAGVQKIPHWIGHTEADVDGMGFSDVIFPAFLFIVGLSLPFAIQTRLKKKSIASTIIYIVLRSVALIIMGFFHVNMENYNHDLAIVSYPIFMIVLTIAFFLVWLDYPDRWPKPVKYFLVAVGISTLFAMAYLYKGGNAEKVEGLKPHWWGILGIIGWAYLVTALSYLLTKGKLSLVAMCFIIFALINITSHLGLLKIDLFPIGDASSITLMAGGVFLSTLYTTLVAKGKSPLLWLVLALAGLFCLIFGFSIRPYAGGISKIYSTPAWVFICMGIAILTFELLMYIVDFNKKGHWFKLINAAGTSTLTCYLMPYLLYSIFSLIGFQYPNYFNYGFGGIIRSAFIAVLVIQIVRLLEKRQLRLSI